MHDPLDLPVQQAHLWDSGANAVDELNRIMQVRAAALKQFGENNIRPGAPLATIEDVLVPSYMLHRYQAEAAAKSVQVPTEIVPPDEQRRALRAILATLKPEEIAIGTKTERVDGCDPARAALGRLPLHVVLHIVGPD